MNSESGSVEVGKASGHLSLTVILVHIGKRDVLRVEFLACLVPPNGKVFAEGAAYVGTMMSGL